MGSIRDKKTTKENEMFTVQRELRFDGVSKKYIVKCSANYGKRYAVIESYKPLNRGDVLSSAIKLADSNNAEYLLKKFN
jgi:hypothetical protein